MLLILHIPKTAGTSLRVSLQNEFGLARIALDYRDQSDDTSSIVRHYLYQNDASLGTGDLIQNLRATGYQALIGHFPFSKYGEFFLPSEVIAFVREPLVRSCSEYLHKRRHNKMEGTFSEFIENPRNQNLQAKMLNGHHQENFIGITERYADSLSMLNKRFGLQVKERKANRAPRGGGMRFLEGLDPKIVDRYRELNQQDIVMYRESLSKLEKLQPTIARRKGWVQRITSRNPGNLA
jgi:Sulfotransferase family